MKTKKIIILIIALSILSTNNIVLADKKTNNIKTTAHQIHKSAWQSIAEKSGNQTKFKYAIYQSRSIAVKHPELYLQADALFNDEVLTNLPMMKKFYLNRTQDLEKQINEYDKLIKKLFNNEGENISKFKWSEFKIQRHNKVDYKKVYHTEAFLPFIDIRMHFMGSALKGTNWQATPLSMAEFLYFKFREENNYQPYILMDKNGIAYVYKGKSKNKGLLSFLFNKDQNKLDKKTHQLIKYNGKKVNKPSSKIVF